VAQLIGASRYNWPKSVMPLFSERQLVAFLARMYASA
jgi:hypothetical protein